VGIKTKIRTMERAAFVAAWSGKKLHRVCVCVSALYGSAASRLSEFVPSDGMFSRGADPDVDALYKQQARETDRKKREAMLHRDPAAHLRARALRPHLRVHLAQCGGSVSGRAGPAPHRSLSLVGAPRGVRLKPR
jgi:hypothetical protein